MKILKLQTKLSPTERQSLKFITASLLLVLSYQTYHTYLSSRMLLLTDLAILVSGSIGCYLILRVNRLNRYARLFLLLILYFFMVGMIYGDSIMTDKNLSIALEQDLRYVLLFFMGGIFASNSRMMSSFHRLMKWLAVFSIIFGILGLIKFDFVASAIAEREGTWTMSYYYWWASTACFSYWGYYFLFMKRQKILGLGVLLIYVVLGALFVKRAALANGLILLFVYFLFNKGGKIGSFFKVILVAAFAVAMTFFLSPKLFNTITDTYAARIESAQNQESLDRNEEAFAYLDNTTTPQLIFGNGIGHYPKIIGYRDYNYQINSIHIGWANILYKGGFVYALFYLMLLIQVLKRAYNVKTLNAYQKVCLGVAVSSFVSLLYEGSWTYTLYPVCISAPLFYLLSDNRNEFV